MDYMGMVRALVKNVQAGEIKQGASTITQQVVKIFMLSPDRTFERKVQELILARRLEQAFTKKEILELYLNEIYLGHGRYGVEEASQFYFGKSVRDIDLAQAAVLATLPKAPGRDSPLQNPDKATARQRYVLGQMVEHGFCTPADAEAAMGNLGLAAPEARTTTKIATGAEEFVDAVREQLEERYGDELRTLGAEVVTTVSLPLQREARAAVIRGLQGVDERNGYARKLAPADEKAKAAALATGEGGLAVGREVPGVVIERGEGLPEGGFAARIGTHDVFVSVPEGSRWDAPKATLDEQFPVGAVVSLRVVKPPAEEAGDLPARWGRAEIAAGPESAVVVADVTTGEVLAMIGGSSYDRAQFNRALKAERQPGSAFKPFVYGAALQSKQFTAATLISDSPEIYEKWRPTNFLRDRYRGDIRMRSALTSSVNTVAIKLADMLGIEKVQAFARAAGIESELPDDLSLALGTGEVTPFEMARAYLTLARGGDRIEPVLVQEVIAPRGKGWRPDRASERTLPEDVVFVLTSMMQSVVEQGTGTKAKALGRPVAGKTGTSGDFHDAWFAGFTPQRVAVTWVGFDRPRRLGKAETGGAAAIPIWLDVMRAASDGESVAFRPPPTVSVRSIDEASGLLVPTGPGAEDYQGKAIEEYFLAGTEPKDEAVPAALPKGDVLLGLYDEEAADAIAEGGADEDPEEATPTKTAELPSVDE
jgi:penicillin-binding protein 1A